MRLFNVIFILFLLGFAFQTYAQEEETDESEKKEGLIIMEEESIDEGSDFFDFDAMSTPLVLAIFNKVL